MPLEPLTVPRLLICEGPADVAFFSAFVTARGLPEFCIRHTGQGNPSGTGGVDVFTPFLDGLPSVTGFYELTDIVLVADSDADPNDRFQYLCRQIEKAKPDAKPPVAYIAPEQPNQTQRQIAPASGTARLHILLLPAAASQGCLETLCIEAATDLWKDEARCVDELAQCTGADAWPVPKMAKMKLSALMASVFRRNPNVAFARIWIEGGPNELVPLHHSCFDPIEMFLRSIMR